MKPKAALVIGARPQFIKAAPLILEMGRFFNVVLIHTGQHYDFMMSDNFFSELNLPLPDFHLNCNGRSAGKVIGQMISDLESVYEFEKPDLVVVIGDTNSTLAGSLAAAHGSLPICHVEAGVRSKNQKLPEQINRVVTDSISDYFLCPTSSSVNNLKNEGKTDNIHDTGDIIYDCLRLMEKRIPDRPSIQIDIPDNFVLVTIHRAEAVDNKNNLENILHSLGTSPIPVIFPAHPRTAKMIDNFHLKNELPQNVILTEPIGYLDLLSLIRLSDIVITDSGGVQREAVFLNKIALIPRPETEWVEFEQMNCLKVVGYEFDVAEFESIKSKAGEDLTQLLRPSAKNMAEILTSLF